MSSPTQKSRAVRIFTPLPDDTLLVSAIDGQESLSKLFEYNVECISEDSNLDLYDLLGETVTIEIDSNNDSIRYVNGMVKEAHHTGSRGEYALYELVITAWPWMLTRTADCRIFADINVPDIIAEVVRDNGFSDIDNRLMGSYDAWNFCVQYQETDFDFISRLMEHEGIYYYFEHQQGKHTMVLCDGASAHATVSEYDSIPHYPESTDQLRHVDHLTHWQFRKRICSAKFATKDFAFDQPKRDLLVNSSEPLLGNYEAKEIYSYPGGYSNTDTGELTRNYGEKLAKNRMEEMSANHEIAGVKGNVRGITAGNLFNLINCERDDQNREYLVISAKLNIALDSYRSGDGGTSVEITSEFHCMPSSVPYRAPLVTPKPLISGPQTAIVVGPAGDEIYTDQHGRVKLQFHWDRYGKSDENSSCWVRVSQVWAGEKWGSIHIPRIGQEVIVEFIDGDPDRPIITGRVYNGDRPVPYDLPANATQSGIKSRSSKGGKPANFNEIRMEDKKGSEELYIHAEKDQNNVVENNETTNVGNDRTEDVGNNESITIGNDRTESVGNNESISIAKDRQENVGNNETISIGKNRTESVGDNESISIGANRDKNVARNESTTIGDNRTETVGKAEEISIGKKRTLNVGDDYVLSVAKAIGTQAGDEIVLSTGKASITLKKDGTITLSGKNITFKATGGITAKASKNVVLKGSKVLQN